MTGEIKIGMKFGSYDQMTEKLKRKYDTESRTTNEKLQSEYLFTSKKKSIVGNAYREALAFDSYGNSKFVDAVLFYNDYQYGVTAKEWNKLNDFDYIQGKSEHAVDINGNGIVDDGEIFKDNLDRDAYKKAKESGDIKNYQKFLYEFKLY